MLLLASILIAMLLYRVGWFSTWELHREALTFETHLLQAAEEDAWERQMQQARVRHQQGHPQPMLRLR